MSLKERAKALTRDIPAVFLALKAKETPLIAKALAFLTVAYAFSPVDLIPDFIPVLGYLDDLLILPALVALTVRLIPGDIFAECQRQAEQMGQKAGESKWYYALPVALLWLILIAVIVWMIC